MKGDGDQFSECTAVIGGNRRQWRRGGRHFQAAKFGGNGELRRLEAALRGGQIHEVVVLIRWISHSESGQAAALARRYGVPLRRLG